MQKHRDVVCWFVCFGRNKDKIWMDSWDSQYRNIGRWRMKITRRQLQDDKREERPLCHRKEAVCKELTRAKSKEKKDKKLVSEHASRSQGKKMYETRFWYSCLLTITSSQNYFVKITWKGSSLSFYLSIILNNFWVILWDEILETQKMRIWTVDTRQNKRKLKKRKNYAFNNSNKFFSSISYFFRRQKHLFFEMICQVTCPCSSLKQFLFFNQSWEDTCEHPHQLIFCFHRSFILKGGRFVWATGSHSLLVLAVWCVWSRSNHQLRIHFSGDPTWYVAVFFFQEQMNTSLD